jgi:hypothetical protein
VGWDIDGSRIAVGYMRSSVTGKGYVRMLDATTGQETGVLNSPFPGGSLDTADPVTFKNGRIVMEEDLMAKFTEIIVP